MKYFWNLSMIPWPDFVPVSIKVNFESAIHDESSFCHNFAHATTAGLSCHVQNRCQIESLVQQLDQRVFSYDLNYVLLS